MARICPSCKSYHVRRSSVRTSEITWRHIFLSPYRCRDCQTRFWVIGRNTYYLGGIVGLSLLVAASGWNAGNWQGTARNEPAEAETLAQRLAELSRRAESNDAVAEFELARLYERGIGVERSAAQEYKWLERSADHGNAQAQYELGIALRDGRDTIQDFDAASHWMKRAAEAGNGQAQLAFGHMYRTGLGVPVDYVKAYVWLNVAAAQGVPGAAASRDSVLPRLAATELQDAQAESRRLSALFTAKAAAAK